MDGLQGQNRKNEMAGIKNGSGKGAVFYEKMLGINIAFTTH
jgi:hypothetical protein